jgi:MFS family permease
MPDVRPVYRRDAGAMHIALTHHRFGRLLAALAASQLGDWLYNLALLACVQERTHSTAWLGITTAARIGPMVVGGPLGGLLADRVDRRALMIAADAARAGLMGVLVLAVATSLPVILIPLLAAAVTLAGTPYPSCVAAMTPRLVPERDLVTANGARGMITPACVAAGPVLGALLLLLGPPTVVFAIDALTFIVSGALVASIPAGVEFSGPRDERAAGSPPAVLSELRQGARALLAAPGAARMVSADVAGSFVYGSQTVLLLLVAERLGLRAQGYGYLLAAQGLGGILGASAAGRLGRTASRRSTLAGGLVMVALPLPLLALTGSVAIALVLGVIAGAGALLVEVVVDARLQQTLDDARLGCAYGFAFAASVGGIAAGALVAPVLVALLGADGALAVIGAAVLGLATVIAAPRRLLGGRVDLEQPDPLGDARRLHA